MSSKSGGLLDNFKRNNWTISEDYTIALFLKIQNKKHYIIVLLNTTRIK